MIIASGVLFMWSLVYIKIYITICIKCLIFSSRKSIKMKKKNSSTNRETACRTTNYTLAKTGSMAN